MGQTLRPILDINFDNTGTKNFTIQNEKEAILGDFRRFSSPVLSKLMSKMGRSVWPILDINFDNTGTTQKFHDNPSPMTWFGPILADFGQKSARASLGTTL